MTLSDFNYHLPEGLIAQRPTKTRDASRLMVVHRDTGQIEHRKFSDVIAYLKPGDGLVLNRTRVMRARLLGRRKDTNGNVEAVLIREVTEGLWETLLRPSRRLAVGSVFVLEDGISEALVSDGPDTDSRYLRFPNEPNVPDLLQRVGRLPLPPYVLREDDEKDVARYQTVYGDALGAIAAPTAGLHFTESLLQSVADKGVSVIPILLHVGPGTFQPVRVDQISDHKMEKEYYSIDTTAAGEINGVRTTGRIVAVGTTSVRTLETAASDSLEPSLGHLRPCQGWTNCFIYPPYDFKVVDSLLTNFHLPRSTLLMLVCAFAGKDPILHAYEEAVREGYRFYSYGDAMLIV
ncbi:MAG: tRNA preQ1(34) S-adenosylmethionine ribosyltransferase-isomerase QueA [Candidatus Latescibacteria bacterium]|nr:tRNA preQ1(34) S-adenosylmethionine ribosyltransferase-isomerase QueA [Candidatus Latescibacterota bacterium]